jgi:hypothetical protein
MWRGTFFTIRLGNIQLIFLQETCLADTDGMFHACAPHDLVCLCNLDQDELALYVSTVQSCIDGEVGHTTCTDGAIYREFPRTLNDDC